MSLISYGIGKTEEPESAISNNGFWPPLDPANFRDAERVDSTITAPRLDQALRIAVADVNRQLADFQSLQMSAGHATADDVPPPSWATPDHYPLLYRRAIYATAKAALLERYRDTSATGAGDERGQAKDEAADDYRRDARWAVSEILGQPHTTVELI